MASRALPKWSWNTSRTWIMSASPGKGLPDSS
jgi:hypothetical protein